MPLSELLAMAHPNNPKEHDLDALSDSFVRFGFVAYPTIDEATSTMAAGHGRCLALARIRNAGAAPPRGVEERGMEWWVPVVRGVSFKSATERDAYVLADNQHVMAGGWKFDVLADMLRQLKESEDGFSGLGFETVEIDSLLGNYIADEPPDDGFDPEQRTRGDGDRPTTQITATITCPNCKHTFQR